LNDYFRPAVNKWEDPSYFQKKYGNVLVPVDYGQSPNYSSKMMQFRKFIKDHLLDKKRIGFVRQHGLFDQIPQLKEDIIVPAYTDIDLGGLYMITASLCPVGVITTLHKELHHNLLTQVVGYKYVRLYAPCEVGRLYPHKELFLRNVSQ